MNWKAANYSILCQETHLSVIVWDLFHGTVQSGEVNSNTIYHRFLLKLGYMQVSAQLPLLP